jgi:hypothetical protein
MTTFEGLMSRWTTPRRCASERASAVWRATSTARATLMPGPASISPSVCPETSSITMKGWPSSVSPKSWTAAMFVWRSFETACASRRKRAR